MFNDIQTNSSQRIAEIREFFNFIAPLIPAAPTSTPRYLNTCKGLVFVQLYGVIEYTILSTISKCIFYINQESIKLNDVKPIILGLVLNPELDSLMRVSLKKWDKRYSLFKKVEDDIIINIANDLMPTDGKNIQYLQLQSIWNTFCLTEPIFHDIRFRGRLEDIVTNRINIAHGNQSAADVGTRMTLSEIKARVDDVSAFCSYFISVFEDYIVNKKYKK